jgi:uncharacterized protein with NRDE domain
MCIIFLAYEDHPVYSLVVASNRDEEQNRTAAPCGWWERPHAGVLGGRDLRQGGTWLGVHPRHGVWAALTNVREPSPGEGERSRGELPLQLLSSPGGGVGGSGALGASELREALAHVRMTADSYSGYNLLVGGGDELWWLSNRASSDGVDASACRQAGSPRAIGRGAYAERLAPGMHAISNASLDTPWPKVLRTTCGLLSIL